MPGIWRWLAAVADAPRPAQAPGLGASAELVDPKVFRVCADPHDLPFSDEQAKVSRTSWPNCSRSKLNEPASYTYYPQVIGFVRNTLNALRCDVVMGAAVGDDLVQTTNPYYRTTYALVFRPGSGLDGIDTLEDPRLKGKHIGIVAGTPPATCWQRMGLMADAKPYPLTVDTRDRHRRRRRWWTTSRGTDRCRRAVGSDGGYYAQQANAAADGRAAAERAWSDGLPHCHGRAQTTRIGSASSIG